MPMQAKHLVGAAVAVFLYLDCGLAAAVGYSLTLLPTLGGSGSFARAINNAGQVVGSASIAGDAADHAMLWSGGTVVDLCAAACTGSFATDINQAGQVVGSTYDAGPNRAVLWNGTVLTALSAPDDGIAIAWGINNVGQVVGRLRRSGGHTQATLWSGGAAVDLATLGGSYSVAKAINDAGMVVGYSATAADASTHATLWNAGSVTDLDGVAGSISFALDVNAAGQIVGYAAGAAGAHEHAMLWAAGTATELPTLAGMNAATAWSINALGHVVGYSYSQVSPDGAFLDSAATLWDGQSALDLNSFLDAATVAAGWHLDWASGINDHGVVIGGAYNSITGLTRGFMLSPVPESSTAVLLAGGLAWLWLGRLRRQRDPLSAWPG